MSLQDQRRLHDDLAWTWPIISAKEHYVHEAETFVNVLRTHARREVKTLLHLGCGGGHLDYTLKAHLAITGVDLSEAMLSLARQLNPEVTYLAGDMRAVRLGQTFDAVMAADSIDYVLTEDDLRAAFATAFTHLKPGGAFCAYAEETAGRFQQNRTRCSVRSQGNTEIVLVENAYDPDPADTTYENLFVYLIRRGGRLQVETDRHLGGLFPVATWLRLLGEAGFQVTQLAFDDEESIPLFVGVKPDNGGPR
jgi:SAM-dependent methyltransferase